MELKVLGARARDTAWSRLAMSLALVLLLGVVLVSSVEPASAATSDIRMTKHNLSKYQKDVTANPNTTKSTTEDQVCVFCHTPHAATAGVNPLWNRSVTASATYTKYTSNSLDATAVRDALNGTTSGSSLLCLSCHDGQIALGNVNVNTGRTGSAAQISVNGSTATTMPTGSGATTGYTRQLGTNLANDHPISITYDDGLAGVDGELQRLTTTAPKQRDTHSTYNGTLIGIRDASTGYKPTLPLQATGTSNAGQVQCSTCHDPHITEERFLRLNRTQKNNAPSGDFTASDDIICLACHTKLGDVWAQSAHAKETVAGEVYKAAPATTRGFATGIKVWQAACLNCHDTHSVQGARRLLREGTDATPATALQLGGFKAGGNSAIEQTCYQCHATTTNSILTLSALTASEGVPDIQTEFSRARRMPIVSAAQGGGTSGTTEKHDISNADFIETATLLGAGATGNRHVECTDCHNPHRVIKNELFNGQGTIGQRTHKAGGTAANQGADGNIASGVLRGTWGVEPTYTIPNVWPEMTMSMTVKQGDPGVGAASTARGSAWLTREYQLCFKCHSNYANSSTKANYPSLVTGTTNGGTPNGTNSMDKFTNVAGEMSYNATDTPTSGTDQGEAGQGTARGTDLGISVDPTGSYPADTLGTGMSDYDTTTTQNHRSWHPVRMPTGRTRDERRMATTGGNFRAPFDTYVGAQTMHCSDCHGADASWTDGSGPILTTVQGPHGSDNNFLLRSQSDNAANTNVWSSSTAIGSPGFCGRCHNPTSARCDSNGTDGGQGCSGDATARVSGFNDPGQDGGGGHGNGHSSRSCMRCHVAVPHGWKNKALLVNLRCVGTEGGQANDNCNVVSPFLTNAPYYIGAGLRVTTWRPSGNWYAASCGGTSWMQSNC